MVGAITVLIAIVTVFLAYNANSGLPFVPLVQHLGRSFRTPIKLVPGNEVRIGGVRVGQITAIDAGDGRRDGRDSTPSSSSALDPDVEELPVDSTDRSSGRGPPWDSSTWSWCRATRARATPPGSIVPLSAARPEPVDIDDFLDTFDEPTRTAIQANLFEFGNALAGRGPDLNAALGELPGDARGPRARDGEPELAGDPARAVHRHDLRRRRRGRAGRRASRPRCSSISTRRSPRSRASRRRSRRRSSRRRRPSPSPTETLPTIRPVPGQQRRRSSTSCARASTPRRRRRRRSPTPSRQACRRCNDSPKLNRELAPTARVAPALQRQRDRPLGPLAARADDGRVRPGDPATSGRRRPSATTGAFSSATWRASPASAPTAAATSGSPCSSRPTGPNNEGSLAYAAGERPAPTARTSSTTTRIRTPPRPSQSPTECEAGNEPYLVGPAGHRERAGRSGHHHRGPAPLPDQARGER